MSRRFTEWTVGNKGDRHVLVLYHIITDRCRPELNTRNQWRLEFVTMITLAYKKNRSVRPFYLFFSCTGFSKFYSYCPVWVLYISWSDEDLQQHKEMLLWLILQCDLRYLSACRDERMISCMYAAVLSSSSPHHCKVYRVVFTRTWRSLVSSCYAGAPNVCHTNQVFVERMKVDRSQSVITLWHWMWSRDHVVRKAALTLNLLVWL